MSEMDYSHETTRCQLCGEEPCAVEKTITVYSARVNPVYGGLPQRRRTRKGQEIKQEAKATRIYSHIEPVEVNLGSNCSQKRWEGLFPWASGLGVVGLFLTFMTRPPTPAAFVLDFGFFMVLILGFLAVIYDPDEYIVRKLNAQRTEYERYKAFFTRRVYKRLMRKAKARQRRE